MQCFVFDILSVPVVVVGGLEMFSSILSMSSSFFNDPFCSALFITSFVSSISLFLSDSLSADKIVVFLVLLEFSPLRSEVKSGIAIKLLGFSMISLSDFSNTSFVFCCNLSVFVSGSLTISQSSSLLHLGVSHLLDVSPESSSALVKVSPELSKNSYN